MRPKVHVILVSAQPTPNITPALDPALKPEEVIMLVSPDMGERAEWLEAVLRPQGLKVTREPIPDAYEFERLRERLFDLLAQRDGESLALNVTGGTKLMALAAYEAFHEAGLPIFYVHPELDRLIWMRPAGREPLELADRIKLKPFFQAHGVTLTPGPAQFGMPEPLRQLAGELVRRVSDVQNDLGTLNWLAAEAARTHDLVSPPLERRLERPEFELLIHWLGQEGLLTVEKNRLRFADENARQFVNGGWLEQYVYATVQALRQEIAAIQDVGRGLEVFRHRGGSAVPNELDVAFLKDNRLHVIECKTRKFAEDGDGGTAADPIYKLDSLKSTLGGIQAKAMLVSYRPIPDHARDRAREHRIEVCAAAEIKTLSERLRRWIR